MDPETEENQSANDRLSEWFRPIPPPIEKPPIETSQGEMQQETMLPANQFALNTPQYQQNQYQEYPNNYPNYQQEYHHPPMGYHPPQAPMFPFDYQQHQQYPASPCMYNSSVANPSMYNYEASHYQQPYNNQMYGPANHDQMKMHRSLRHQQQMQSMEYHSSSMHTTNQIHPFHSNYHPHHRQQMQPQQHIQANIIAEQRPILAQKLMRSSTQQQNPPTAPVNDDHLFKKPRNVRQDRQYYRQKKHTEQVNVPTGQNVQVQVVELSNGKALSSHSQQSDIRPMYACDYRRDRREMIKNSLHNGMVRMNREYPEGQVMLERGYGINDEAMNASMAALDNQERLRRRAARLKHPDLTPNRNGEDIEVVAVANPLLQENINLLSAPMAGPAHQAMHMAARVIARSQSKAAKTSPVLALGNIAANNVRVRRSSSATRKRKTKARSLSPSTSGSSSSSSSQHSPSTDDELGLSNKKCGPDAHQDSMFLQEESFETGTLDSAKRRATISLPPTIYHCGLYVGCRKLVLHEALQQMALNPTKSPLEAERVDPMNPDKTKTELYKHLFLMDDDDEPVASAKPQETEDEESFEAILEKLAQNMDPDSMDNYLLKLGGTPNVNGGNHELQFMPNLIPERNNQYPSSPLMYTSMLSPEVAGLGDDCTPPKLANQRLLSYSVDSPRLETPTLESMMREFDY